MVCTVCKVCSYGMGYDKRERVGDRETVRNAPVFYIDEEDSGEKVS